MSLEIQPCTSEAELAQAKALIEPTELQSVLPEGYYWAFVKEDGVNVGALMWPFGTEQPTDISIAPTLMDETNPNQNLYWGGE